jgi:hypothetical protein
MSEAVTTEQQRREYIEALMAGERELPERADLRAMLACWAPQDIPHWFSPQMPTERPRAIFVGDDGKTYTSVFDAERANGEDGFSYANTTDIERWDLEFVQQKYFQWRIYYADRMLECLAK